MKVDDETTAWVRPRDGVAHLYVYTTNEFGGADVSVAAADTPTIDGGLIGTTTSKGYRYLFGGGLGPIRSWDGVSVSMPRSSDTLKVRAEYVNAVGEGWVIAVPDSLSLDDLTWRLVGSDGAVFYKALGVGSPPVASPH